MSIFHYFIKMTGQTKAIADDFGCVCIKICFPVAMKTEPKQLSFQTNGFQEVDHVLKHQDNLMIETYNMFPNIIDISVMSLYESQSEIVGVFSISLFYLSTIYFAKSEIFVLTSCFHAGFFRVFFLWTTRSPFHPQFLKDYRYNFLHSPPFILEIGTDLPSCWPSNRTSIQVFFAKPTTLVKFGEIFSISLRKSNVTDKKPQLVYIKCSRLNVEM